MDDTHNDSGLPLPDLYIENFRGIRKLSIPHLGRVTLLAGRNGVGKTSVLEAVEVFAGRASYFVLRNILFERDEVSYAQDENRDKLILHEWEAIFYGRDSTRSVRTTLGPKREEDRLSLASVSLIELIRNQEGTFGTLASKLPLDSEPYTLCASFQGNDEIVPALLTGEKDSLEVVSDPMAFERELGFLSRQHDSRRPSPIKCERIGPGYLRHIQLPKFWGHVALRDDETRVVKALKIVYGEEVDRISVISDEASRTTLGGQRAIVKLRNHDAPVPLRSLGGGATRLFGLALALAYCRNGILLIDEAENGIHHTAQRDYWRMVLQTAHENNVQVFATTHSWDCVRGFAQAAVENKNVEGVLVRLEKEEDGLRAVRYSERRLKIAAEQRIEVR